MANKLSEDKRRMTYTEWKDTYAVLEQIAKERRLDVAVVIREATLEYAERQRHPEPQKTKRSPKKSN